MSAPKRSRIAIEADRAFLFDLMRKSPPNFTITKVAEVLNARREQQALETAQAMGEDESACLAIAKEERLSFGTVSRDIQTVQSRIRLSTDSSAAILLDEQMAMCLRDIEDTYDDDDEIRTDLERSRSEKKTVTKGTAGPSGSDITNVIRTTGESAGRAALWNAIIRNRNARGELRAEMRLLQFGRAHAQLASQERTSFASAVTGETDPAKAREIALEALGQEIDWLAKVEALDIGPSSQEISAMHRGRLASSTHRLRMIREFVEVAVGDGEKDGFEFRVTRISVSKKNGREVHDI